MLFKLKITALLINILFISNAYSQYSKNLVSIEKQINTINQEEVLLKLKKINPNSLQKADKALYNYLLAKSYEFTNEEDKACKYYLDAKKLYKEIDSIDREMSINLDIAYLTGAQENNKTTNAYLNEYIKYAEKKNDPVKKAKGYIEMASFKADNKDYITSFAYYKKAMKVIKNTNNERLKYVISHNIAALYTDNFKKPDSALFYLKNNLDYLNKTGNSIELCSNYISQAGAYYHLKEHKNAIKYLKQADSIPLGNFSLKTKQYIYEFLYKNYDELKDYPNAYKYLLLNKKFADSVNVTEQNIAISDIQTKYQTAEKELENTQLKSNIKTNRILLYTFTSLLIASLIIAFLVYKNAKRREKISLQEKLIEQQKLEKALKDYELHSIDLMLEGQEKERQRIANDLHDNLGSMLATLKLNFENLRLRKNELKDEENKLYERTDELIEEAYQKVRRLAHAKNAGVFASQGLIPAIKKLAEKISIPGKLQIQVIPFGFNDRLENTLEIAIFRAVQELSTNIIKHSEATEATIHLTNHEDNINIIIEDNGIGFDSKKISTADGMGLQTIQKKITQLGGTFTIDTTPEKGTTIIIDIPI